MRTRIVSAYQPNSTKYSNYYGSVYKQHERHFLLQNIDEDPTSMFQTDLRAALKTWIHYGDKIVLMLDANEDVHDGLLSKSLVLMGPVSVQQSRFGRTMMTPTYQRGSVPIDNIFVSRSITSVRADMLGFGNDPGDHRALFYVKQLTLIGDDPYKIHRQPARRLISTNPIIVDRFNRDYESQLPLNHVHEQMQELYNTFDTPMTSAQIEKYEKLDRICVSAFHYANKRCRKLCMGAVPSSDEMTIASLTIRLWTYVICKKTCCKVNSKMIQRTADECGISSPMRLSVQDAKQKRTEAWKEYYTAASMADELRDAQLDRLAEIIAEQEGEDKATVIRKK